MADGVAQALADDLDHRDGGCLILLEGEGNLRAELDVNAGKR